MSFLAEHSADIKTCTHCPRLCRFVCPAAESECNETSTPTSLMSLVYLLQKGQFKQTWSEAVDTLEHCSMCGRCTTACVHELTPYEVLLDARSSLRRGATPPDLDTEKTHRVKQALTEIRRQMESREGKYLVLGRASIAPQHLDAFYALLETTSGKGIVTMDPVMEAMLPDLERGYYEPYRGLVNLVHEIVERAERVYTFEDQTPLFLCAFLDADGRRMRKCRSAWELVEEMVEGSPVVAPKDTDAVVLVPSCGMRKRVDDYVRIRRILELTGIPYSGPAPSELQQIGCCGGGGYPAELQEDMAAWSLRSTSLRSGAIMVSDRLDCATRYSGTSGRSEPRTVLDLLAQLYTG